MASDYSRTAKSGRYDPPGDALKKLKAKLPDLMKAADKNGNGTIEQEEFPPLAVSVRSVREKCLAEVLTHPVSLVDPVALTHEFDKDGDGKLNAEEQKASDDDIRTRDIARFTEIDKDKNCQLTIDEIQPGLEDVLKDGRVRGIRIPPFAVPNQRGPYLQVGTPTSIIVRWRTPQATDSCVRYGLTPGQLTERTDDPKLTTEHEVKLGGLTPQTRYYYSIGTTKEVQSGGKDYFFVTSPPPGATRPVRFFATGCFGFGNNATRAVRDGLLAFAGDRPPQLWLTLGDNAYFEGTDEQYQEAVFNTYEKVLRNCVLWPALGNHDGRSADSKTQTGVYYDIFSLPRNGEAGGIPSGTEAYYSFDYGDIHFVCLDSYETPREKDGPMMTWLKKDLAAAAASRWKIAYWHHPPYTKGTHGSDKPDELGQMRESAVPILEEAGIDLVLCAHSHNYERSFLIDGHHGRSSTFRPEMLMGAGSGREDAEGPYLKEPGAHHGAVYVVMGSSGEAWGGGKLDHPAMFLGANVLGSLVVDIADGRMDVRFIRESGDIIDYFTILKRDPKVSE